MGVGKIIQRIDIALAVARRLHQQHIMGKCVANCIVNHFFIGAQAFTKTHVNYPGAIVHGISYAGSNILIIFITLSRSTHHHNLDMISNTLNAFSIIAFRRNNACQVATVHQCAIAYIRISVPPVYFSFFIIAGDIPPVIFRGVFFSTCFTYFSNNILLKFIQHKLVGYIGYGKLFKYFQKKFL